MFHSHTLYNLKTNHMRHIYLPTISWTLNVGICLETFLKITRPLLTQMDLKTRRSKYSTFDRRREDRHRLNTKPNPLTIGFTFKIKILPSFPQHLSFLSLLLYVEHRVTSQLWQLENIKIFLKIILHARARLRARPTLIIMGKMRVLK